MLASKNCNNFSKCTYFGFATFILVKSGNMGIKFSTLIVSNIKTALLSSFLETKPRLEVSFRYHLLKPPDKR